MIAHNRFLSREKSKVLELAFLLYAKLEIKALLDIGMLPYFGYNRCFL